MTLFEGVTYLGARNPLTQIADQIKKLEMTGDLLHKGLKKLKQITIVQVIEKKKE